MPRIPGTSICPAYTPTTWRGVKPNVLRTPIDPYPAITAPLTTLAATSAAITSPRTANASTNGMIGAMCRSADCFAVR